MSRWLSPLLPWRRTADDVREAQRAYQIIFRSPSGAVVLRDLAYFARGTQSTWSPDAREHARLEGRREVWDRVMQNLGLSQEELLDLYSGRFAVTSGEK